MVKKIFLAICLASFIAQLSASHSAPHSPSHGASHGFSHRQLVMCLKYVILLRAEEARRIEAEATLAYITTICDRRMRLVGKHCDELARINARLTKENARIKAERDKK